MSPPRSAQSVHALSNVRLLERLPTEVLARVGARCSWRVCEAGEHVVDYLDASDDVYFIADGCARAILYSLDGKAITFSDLRAGDVFGEYAAIDGAHRSVSIEAVSKCVVASMPAATFRSLLETEPAVSMALLEALVARIRTLTTRVYEVSALAVGNRIQAELLRLANMGTSSDRTAVIDPAPTHADIASRTRTHREAVSRELSRLARLGLLARSGRVLIIKDLGRLAAMVHEATGE